jgi:hypothetical protein
MKKLYFLIRIIVLWLLSITQSISQTTVFKTSARVTDRQLYSILKSNAKDGEVQLFEYESDISNVKSLVIDISGKPINFVRDELDLRGPGDYSWFGVNKVTGSRIVLVSMSGHLSGHIYHNLSSYSIAPYGNKSIAMFLDLDSQSTEISEPPREMEIIKMPKNTANRVSTEVDSIVTIRLLLAYTPETEALIASPGTAGTGVPYPDIRLFLQLSVDKVNLAYKNSKVAHRVRLVCGVKLNYPTESSDDLYTILSKFRGTTDGTMDEVHTYRAKYSADVCVFVARRLAAGSTVACGVASSIGSNPSTAFASVTFSCMLISGNYLAHEIGHLHGCGHNIEDGSGSYPHAYGYRNLALKYKTIMSYNCSGCGLKTVPFFSTPDTTYTLDGVPQPIGDLTLHNNAKVLNDNGAILAGFLSTPSTLTIDGTGSLIDKEIGQAIATSEILLANNFEVTDSSNFDALLSLNAGDGDHALLREGAENIIIADEQGNEYFNIYPNPSSGYFNVSRSNGTYGKFDLVLFDNSGKKIEAKLSRFDNSISVDLSSSQSGIYYIKIDDGKKVFTRKIFITK